MHTRKRITILDMVIQYNHLCINLQGLDGCQMTIRDNKPSPQPSAEANVWLYWPEERKSFGSGKQNCLSINLTVLARYNLFYRLQLPGPPQTMYKAEGYGEVENFFGWMEAGGIRQTLYYSSITFQHCLFRLEQNRNYFLLVNSKRHFIYIKYAKQ